MEPLIFLLIAGIGLISYKGFKDYNFQKKYLFHVDGILVRKEYYRIFSSGFLHSGWQHLIFNMIALSSFGMSIINVMGLGNFMAIFFLSLLSGGVLSLYIHRNHGNYRALGASGAISGIIFSSIIISPTSEISLIFMPFGFPAWIMGVLFIGISIVGVKKGLGNIGHDAHLGGAVCGMLLTALLHPTALEENGLVFILLLVPSLGFIGYIVKNPDYLLTNKPSFTSFKNNKKGSFKDKQEQLNDLLDKISREGYDSLSKEEKDRLHNISSNS